MIKKNIKILILSCLSILLFPLCGNNFYFNTKEHFVGSFDDSLKNIYLQKFVVPSDDKYNGQKYFSMSQIGDIEDVWDTYTGEGTTIAVIDDSFATNHKEYIKNDGTSIILDNSRYYFTRGNAVSYINYYEDKLCLEPEYSIDEGWLGHGTETSSTAVSPMNNGGIVGIAPDANILAIRIDMTFITLSYAIEYAISQHVDVINISLGIYAESFIDGFGNAITGNPIVETYLEDLTKEAYDKGIIIVASGGNQATSRKSYPASNSYVIGVGSLGTNSYDLAYYTNYNKANDKSENKNIDILAPGTVLCATVHGSYYEPKYTYAPYSGTSFSSPIVAGAACLWKQKYPFGNSDDFLFDLQHSADKIGEYVNKVVPIDSYVYGAVNPISNIECGCLNIKSLMNYESKVQEINITPSSGKIYTNRTFQTYFAKSMDVSARLHPISALNENIRWVVDDNMLSLSKNQSLSNEKIKLTAKNKKGDTVVKAYYEGNEKIFATIKITILEDVYITGIDLSFYNEETSLMSDYDVGDYRCYINASNNTSYEVTPDSTFFNIDTTSIGFKRISASYRGMEVSKNVLVTNKGASQFVGIGKLCSYLDQAISWAKLMIDYSKNDNKLITWQLLDNEYSYMENESKSYFKNSENDIINESKKIYEDKLKNSPFNSNFMVDENGNKIFVNTSLILFICFISFLFVVMIIVFILIVRRIKKTRFE